MLRLVDNQDLSDNHETYLTAWTGFFGGDISHYEQNPLRFADPIGLPVYRVDDNLLGCSPYSTSYQDSVILTYRGDCTFLQKLLMARSAGAAGVLVVSDEDVALNPTANADEVLAAGGMDDVAIAVLPRQAGNLIDEMMDKAESQGTGRVMVTLDPSRYTENVEEVQDVEEQPSNRILYINGHPLLNTRLLV